LFVYCINFFVATLSKEKWKPLKTFSVLFIFASTISLIMNVEKISGPHFEQNFTTISPSAKTLLLMKGYTSIPFASQVVALVMYPQPFEPDFQNKDFMFWVRVVHFEFRYKSINALLEGLDVQNILELSSGFSFRGLDMATNKAVHYIDTDLDAIIEEKKILLGELQTNLSTLKGKLELFPLNAVNENEFTNITSHFEPGPVAIINEGLLMYLNEEEKRKLCRNIHSILKERGGYWITADIYIKQTGTSLFKVTDKLQSFLDQHKVNDNMFESMESAKAFFESEEFIIDKEADPDYSKLDTLSYFIASASPEILEKMGKSPKIQATWRLKAV